MKGLRNLIRKKARKVAKGVRIARQVAKGLGRNIKLAARGLDSALQAGWEYRGKIRAARNLGAKAVPLRKRYGLGPDGIRAQKQSKYFKRRINERGREILFERNIADINKVASKNKKRRPRRRLTKLDEHGNRTTPRGQKKIGYRRRKKK